MPENWTSQNCTLKKFVNLIFFSIYLLIKNVLLLTPARILLYDIFQHKRAHLIKLIEIYRSALYAGYKKGRLKLRKKKGA